MKTFKSGNITLMNCDCMEYLKTLDDDAFDLAVCDVPYGINVNFKYKENKNKMKGSTAKGSNYKAFDDSKPPDRDYFVELFRVSTNQIIFGANHFCDKFKSDSSCWLVWDKGNGKSNFADCELAYTSFGTAVRMFRYVWAGMHQGKIGGDVRDNEKRIHGTQKPIPLYRWIYANYAKPGQRILDTHGGSFSSAIAAHYAGLEFVGMELDPEYYEAAVARFKKETRQIDFLTGK